MSTKDKGHKGPAGAQSNVPVTSASALPENDAPHPVHDDTGSSGSAETAARRVRAGAEDVLDSAKAGAEHAAERVGATADRIAETLRGAADSLRDGSIQERTFGQLASSLADASDAIRNKDLGEISRDVSRYARQHPALFIGGAALVGFAVAQMMRNSGDRS